MLCPDARRCKSLGNPHKNPFEIELSPESETLSGDIFMSKKISAEIFVEDLYMLKRHVKRCE